MLERAVWFDRLPKIFNWYDSIIEKFIPESKVGRYQHRIKDLQKKVYWEITRCDDAGIDAQEQALFGLNDLENGLKIILYPWLFRWSDLKINRQKLCL